MAIYKAYLKHKDTKDIIIVYPSADTKDLSKIQLKSTYPQYTIKKVIVNKGVDVYYCNTCQKEIRCTEKTTHSCDKKENN